MSTAVDVRLAVEIGASRVKAALGWPDGTVHVLHFDPDPNDAAFAASQAGGDVDGSVENPAERWVDVLIDGPGGTAAGLAGQPWLAAEVFCGDDGSVSVGAPGRRRARAEAGVLVAPVPHLRQPSIPVRGRPVEPVTLLAVLLQTVATAAAAVAGGPPGEVVIAVPAGWGPRWRTPLRQAVDRAGLGRPTVVEAPVAAAWYLLAGGVPLPPGTALAVCDIGAGFEASVLRRTVDRFEILANVDAPAGGDAVDAAIATHLAGVDATLPPVARAVKEALAVRTSILVRPAPHVPPMVVGIDQLRAVAGPVAEAAAQAASQAVDGADLHHAAAIDGSGTAGTNGAGDAGGFSGEEVPLRWVVCIGGAAQLPIWAVPLQQHLGLWPVMAADPAYAVVYGALHVPAQPGTSGPRPSITDALLAASRLAGPPPAQYPSPAGPGVNTAPNEPNGTPGSPPGTGPSSGPASLPAVWPGGRSGVGALGEDRGWWQDLATLLVAAFGAVALYAQFLVGGRRYGPPGGAWLSGHWGGLAAASAMAVLACTVGALLTTAGRYEHHPDPRTRHRVMAVSLGGGGVPGLVVVSVAAVLAAGRFDLPVGPFLRWSMLLALPITVAAATAGAVMLWRPDPPHGGWLAWLRFPALTVLLVGAGEFAIGYDLTRSPQLLTPLWHLVNSWTPGRVGDVITTLGRLGVLAVGAGIALLLVRRGWYRLLAVPLLAALPAATLTVNSAGTTAVGFAIAVAGWWLWRAIYLLLRPVLQPLLQPTATAPTAPTVSCAQSGPVPLSAHQPTWPSPTQPTPTNAPPEASQPPQTATMQPAEPHPGRILDRTDPPSGSASRWPGSQAGAWTGRGGIGNGGR